MHTRALVLPLIILACLLSFMLPSGDCHGSEGLSSPLLIQDLKDPALEYRNFRTARSAFREFGGPLPSREGLDGLRVSGSSEFSKKGLQQIQKLISSGPVTVVDLREESHGYVNDRPVSWKNEHNNANKGMSLPQIINDENEKLQEIQRKDPSAKGIYTEETLCRELGMGYIRLPVTDYSGPDDKTVDRFISLVRALPSGTWLHFHCKAGIGRATTFMVLYDMMHNAGKVSYDDIILRHMLIGGINLSDSEGDKGTWFYHLSQEREAFIRFFYRYCSDRNGNYRVNWSAWKARRNSGASLIPAEPRAYPIISRRAPTLVRNCSAPSEE